MSGIHQKCLFVGALSITNRCYGLGHLSVRSLVIHSSLSMHGAALRGTSDSSIQSEVIFHKGAILLAEVVSHFSAKKGSVQTCASLGTWLPVPVGCQELCCGL